MGHANGLDCASNSREDNWGRGSKLWWGGQPLEGTPRGPEIMVTWVRMALRELVNWTQRPVFQSGEVGRCS